MEQFKTLRVDQFGCVSDDEYFLNILEGEWYPQDFDTNPMKFILSAQDDTDYICKQVDRAHNKILLYHKNNDSIIIEIYVVSQNKMTFNIMNVEAIGTSPKITFIKK